MPATAGRKTAAERREAILDAALTEFAARGFEGASTDTIARLVGISQPYLFRLFGTKKDLFIATVQRCLDDTLELFRQASDGLRGEEARRAIGQRYVEMISSDPRRLRGQMQAYAASDDPEIRAVVRRGFGRLVEHVEGLGISQAEVTAFFARGMLINVMTSIEVASMRDQWARRMRDSLAVPD